MWSKPGSPHGRFCLCGTSTFSRPTQPNRTFFCHLSPVNSTASALTTTTTSPQSSFGQKVGLCFPRMMGAI